MQLLKIYSLFVFCCISLRLCAMQNAPLQIDVSKEMIDQLYARAEGIVKKNVHSSLSSYASGTGPWGPKRKDTIYFYEKQDRYYQFTNFFSSVVYADSALWPTSEHYYQAMKFPQHPEIQTKILLNMPEARDVYNYAKKMENAGKMVSKWGEKKFGVMIKIVWLKFNQNETLKRLLLNTGDKILVEDARERDRDWGAGADYRGTNWLGCILMAVREKLREQDEANSVQNLSVQSGRRSNILPTGQSNRPTKGTNSPAGRSSQNVTVQSRRLSNISSTGQINVPKNGTNSPAGRSSQSQEQGFFSWFFQWLYNWWHGIPQS